MPYEIIVKSKDDALKVILPQEVVNKIKELSRYDDDYFKTKSNEIILKTIIQSLDTLLFGLEHLEEGKTSTDVGGTRCESEKKKNQ